MSRYCSITLKTLKLCSHQWKPKNNGLVLLPKTTVLHLNYLLSSVVMDGEDGNGLKLEKAGQVFQVLKLCLEKLQKSYSGLLSLLNSIRCPLRNSTGEFYVWVKVLSNDLSTELTWTQQIPCNSNIHEVAVRRVSTVHRLILSIWYAMTHCNVVGVLGHEGQMINNSIFPAKVMGFNPIEAWMFVQRLFLHHSDGRCFLYMLFLTQFIWIHFIHPFSQYCPYLLIVSVAIRT